MQSGIPLALASAVLFAASTPFAKLLLGSVGPWLMAGLLYLGAGIGLFGVHLSRKAHSRHRHTYFKVQEVFVAHMFALGKTVRIASATDSAGGKLAAC
jgi:drug/metabolite transporter (DMT)-like permease